MIKPLSLAICLLFSYPALSQDDVTGEEEPATVDIQPVAYRKYAIKVSNLATIRPMRMSGNYSFTHEYRENDYLQPAIALRLQNRRRNFHEIELSEFTLRQKWDQYIVGTNAGISFITAGTRVTTTRLGLRYEYSRPFLKNRNTRLVPSIGFAGGLYYERYGIMPYTTNIFPITETFTGLRTFIVPRLVWNAGHRLFFDLNVPVCILQGGIVHTRQQNPTVQSNLRSFGLADFQVFPQYYSFRLGAGWQF